MHKVDVQREKMIKFKYVALLILLIISNNVGATDVTGQVQYLGNPFNARYGNLSQSLARNVWDMQRDNGIIYLAHGDYTANTGPTDVWILNSQNDSLAIETTIQQEQIDHYTYLNGVLSIPGTDPSGSSNVAYYTRENGSWVSHTISLPFLHCFDVASSGSTILVGLGTSAMNKDSLGVSLDNGATWTKLNLFMGEPTATQFWESRTFTTFAWQGQLYGAGWSQYDIPDPISGHAYPRAPLISFVAPDKGKLLDMQTNSTMFAGMPNNIGYYMIRPVQFGSRLVYLTAKEYDGWTPLKLFVADTMGTAREITLKDNALAYDIVIGNDGKCYVLGNIFVNNIQNIVTVSVSDDSVTWNELFRFQAPSLARSFEYLNGIFYFGLGCTGDNLSASSGNIMKYQYGLSTAVDLSSFTTE